MSFWTSQQLELNLPKLIDRYSDKQVDCNAYTLRIGDEVYVSPTDQTPDPKSSTIRRLAEGEGFTIPQGQFAFLITEETVQVPRDAMAFISMKAKIKFKGLVNVSGFHVDPGFHGRLVFSVFNAGPTVIHLKRGQDCFLIWYASLDEESKKYKVGIYNTSLSPDLINALPGELQSLEGLSRRMKDIEKRLDERINKIEPKQAELITRVTTYTAVVAFFLAAIITYIFRDVLPARGANAPLSSASSPALSSANAPAPQKSTSADSRAGRGAPSATATESRPAANGTGQTSAPTSPDRK